MKKLIYIIALIALVGCNDYDEEPFQPDRDFLTGKSYRADNPNHEFEYLLLLFTSETTVEGWSKEPYKTVRKDWTGSFVIDKHIRKLTINYDSTYLGGSVQKERIFLVVEGVDYTFYLE